MKISTKLTGLSLATVTVICGLTATLAIELKTVSSQYNDLLQGPVRESELARRTQVDFKKQVQEWKDILLRGHNPDDLKTYTSQFHAQESRVKSEAHTLADMIDDPQAKQLLNDFLAADETLSARYQQSYNIYVNSHFDFKAADKLVRGQDRPPTDLFDQVVALLNARVASQVVAQQTESAQRLRIALTVSTVLLLLISLAGLVVVRGVLIRLGRLRAVSERLAKAEIEGLSIDISGNDEVGELGQSLKGVSAALEELLAMVPR